MNNVATAQYVDRDAVGSRESATAKLPAAILIRRIGHVASAFAFIIAVLSLCGFEFHVPALVHPFGSHTSENQHIYVSYVLFGLALLLPRSSGSLRELRTRVVRALAGAVLIIELLHIGNSVLQTRVDLILGSLGILCLSAESLSVRGLAQLVALLIAASSMTSMIANTYALSHLTSWAYLSGQSIIASVLFYFSAIAMLFSQPESGPASIFASSSLGGRIARRLLLPFLLIYPFLGFVTGVGPHYQLDLTIIVLLSNLGLPFLIWLLAIVVRNEESAKVRAHELRVSNDTLNENLAQLLASQNQLQEALNARSQFVAHVSHELRTPLAAILGATGLSLAGPQSEEQRGLTKLAHDSAQSLLRLVNDLLDFSRLDAQKLQLNNSPFQIKSLVESTLRILEPNAAAKHIQLISSINSDVPDVIVGDEGRFKQVLVNLVDNAVKFTAHGVVLVQLSCDDQADRRLLRCSVTDTGIGMPDDQRARIFEPFTQLDNSMTRQFQGAGLGLSIAKKLVELMSGTIGVTSAPGHGSTFSFAIPLQTPDSINEPSGEAEKDENATLASAEANVILIVEDSPVNAKILALQLRKLGHQTEIVCNGQEAVDAIQQYDYALILMDWQMPVMDGIEATKVIRCMESPAAHCVPIIALTAHAMEEHRATCLKAGMSDYLAKPVSLEHLQNAVERWMPKDPCRSPCNASVIQLQTQKADGKETHPQAGPA